MNVVLSITNIIGLLKSKYLCLHLFTDHRLPFVLAVPLDLSAEDFSQSLRDNVPGVPAEFELCRVSSTREVVPLADQCPLDIRNRRELNRSNSYLRPKVV